MKKQVELKVKKYLSILLAVAMLGTSITIPVYAEGENVPEVPETREIPDGIEPPEMVTQEFTYFVTSEGNLITVEGQNGAQILADTPYVEGEAIPENAKFEKVESGNYTNFRSIEYGTVWKSDGGRGTDVFEHLGDLGGWESLTIKILDEDTASAVLIQKEVLLAGSAPEDADRLTVDEEDNSQDIYQEDSEPDSDDGTAKDDNSQEIETETQEDMEEEQEDTEEEQYTSKGRSRAAQYGGTLAAFIGGRTTTYYTVADGKLSVGTNSSSAIPTSEETFEMIETSITVPKKEVWIEHAASGKMVTADGTVDSAIEVTKEAADKEPEDYFTVGWGAFGDKEVVNFISLTGSNTQWKADGSKVWQIPRQNVSGWEAVTMVPNGDRTVSFKDNNGKKYLTVIDGVLAAGSDTLTEEGKFIIHTSTAPNEVTDLRQVDTDDTDGRAVTLEWGGVSGCIYTGYQVWRKEDGQDDDAYELVSGDTLNTTFKDDPTTMKYGTEYRYQVRTVNANSIFAAVEMNVLTANFDKPEAIKEAELKATVDGIEVKIEMSSDVESWKLLRAESKFGEYEVIKDNITDSVYVDDSAEAKDNKYNNYYKIVVTNNTGSSPLSKAFALEMQLFGENMFFFSEKDDPNEIKKIAADIHVEQGTKASSQFGTGRYALMFKKGDYSAVGKIDLGFYTHIGGLGKTPDEVVLDNVHIQAYLNYIQDDTYNATCNFWRSGENFSTSTGGMFMWGVAQAAPLRRALINNPAQFDSRFDWSQPGWASGGYVADSIFTENAGS